MRRTQWVFVGCNRLACVLAAVLVLVFTCAAEVGQKGILAISGPQTYSPQPNRNAEWAGSAAADYRDDQIQKIAQNDGYEILSGETKADIQADFADAGKIVAAAKQYHNDIRVFEYYNAAFLYNENLRRWRPFIDTFNKSWYLHDAQGNPLTYSYRKVPIGYVVDLTNPAYRAWAVNVIVSWMKAAPYKGIALDSADALRGTGVFGNLGNRVNTSDSPATFRLPTAATEFKNGSQAASYPANSPVQLAGRSAMFFLNNAYLRQR